MRDTIRYFERRLAELEGHVIPYQEMDDPKRARELEDYLRSTGKYDDTKYIRKRFAEEKLRADAQDR